MFDPGSKNRLTAHDLGRFVGDGLFDRIARVVCTAECLPRKELYESWQVARHVHRRFRGEGGRLVELCGGHGLLSLVLALMDESFSEVLCIDSRPPKSAATLARVMRASWPKLARVRSEACALEAVALQARDVVVSVHACGVLTDAVLERALAARARVAVLPCCHEIASSADAALVGWLEPTLAIDVMRAARLQRAGYRVTTRRIDAAITPKNRLLLAAPGVSAPARESQ
jgi:hypothetical protein